jgi:hypothetical protein
LDSIKKCSKDKELIKELAWAIDIITSNKLYDPIVEDGGNDQDKSDVDLWLKSYGNNQAENKDKTQTRRLSKFATTIKDRSDSKTGKSLVLKENSFKILPDALSYLNKEADTIEFNCFYFNKLSEKNDLVFLSYHLFDKRSLFDELDIESEVFIKFMTKIQNGYLPNPYHNQIHATDVCQTVNYFLTKGGFIEKATLSTLEIAAMYISAAVHDYEHPGTNNVYHVNTGGSYAIVYNGIRISRFLSFLDKSVLENHHISATFKILKEDEFNIFKKFSKDNYKQVRERMIAMVLSTDMTQHFTDVAQLKGKLAGGNHFLLFSKPFRI